MERKLKERITGAVILVGLAIIVIPSILDGDVRDVERTEVLSMPPPSTVIIPTGDDARVIVTAEDAARLRRTAEVAVAPAADEDTRAATPARPVVESPVVTPPVTATAQESQPRATTPAPDPAPPAATDGAVAVIERPAAMEPAPVAPSAPPVRADPAEGWAVQVGSFASQANANRLADALTELDYKAFVSRKRLDGRVMYRVRVGPRATRSEARELASRLQKDRQSVAIVPHPG